MSLTVNYRFDWAAEGGPGVSLPHVDPAVLTDDTSATMAVVFVGDEWMVVDSQGAVYATAKNPGDLVGWMSGYLGSLGRMVERGEL